jgi:nucleoside-diphosphate-sugar epimerase
VIAVRQSIIDRIADHYRGRNVLVTGGMSFIGSHLVEALVETGASVTVADDLSSGKEENGAGVRESVRFERGDLRDADYARKMSEGQEMVFHLAAAHGGRGYIDTHPVECLNNIVLDHSVYTAAVRAGAEKIVFASSGCTYPTNLQQDTVAQHALKESEAGFDQPGHAFADGEYGWAKLISELQLDAFNRQYGVSATACRLFSAYGERENESHAVIALIAKALARRDPFPIWGDGTQTRNFIYVGDIVAGFVLAGAFMSEFDVINLGTPVHLTIDDLASQIFSIVGWHPSKIVHQPDMPVGVLSRAADNTKLREKLGWTPDISLHEGLSRTIEWYRNTADGRRLSRLDSVLMSR